VRTNGICCTSKYWMKNDHYRSFWLSIYTANEPLRQKIHGTDRYEKAPLRVLFFDKYRVYTFAVCMSTSIRQRKIFDSLRLANDARYFVMFQIREMFGLCLSSFRISELKATNTCTIKSLVSYMMAMIFYGKKLGGCILCREIQLLGQTRCKLSMCVIWSAW
jgi:hypothetical protein